MKIVGIIGGSGFIGSYVTKKFLTETYFTEELTEENYSVRVSTPDISKTEKHLHLLSLPNTRNLEIIELDVMDEENLRAFINGCDIFIYCDRPSKLDITSREADMFEAIVNGTQNLLRIISQTHGLSKVIFVSSIAAHNTNFPLPAAGRPDNHLYKETDAPFISADSLPYNQAKYYADQTVRKFILENPETSAEIVTVSPVLVIGRAMSNIAAFTSTGLQFMIKNKITPTPFAKMLFEKDIEFAVVDVGDVAEAIYKSAVTPGLHGKHYLLSSESWSISDLSRMLNDQFPLGVPRQTVSGALAKRELAIDFKPVQVPMNAYAQIAEEQFQL